PLGTARFAPAAAEARMKAAWGLATLDGLGDLHAPEIAACGALLAYCEETQKGQPVSFALPVAEREDAVCRIDPATRASLELTRTLGGAREGSLLHAVDRTVSPAGARLLAERLAAPLFDLAAIRARHDEVEALLTERPLRDDLRGALKRLPDLPRALSRLALQRGAPRDLGSVQAALRQAHAIRTRLAEAPPALYDLARDLGTVDAGLSEALDAALAEELPVKLTDGGLVRPGHRADLDDARTLRDRSRKVIAGLQARYAEATGIKGLKVKHNNVLGYFVEVNAREGEALRARSGAPRTEADETFVHRQTLANCVRFTTEELGALEREILGAKDRAGAIEAEVFETLCASVVAEAEGLRRLADAAARLDVAAGFARLAEERTYVRPRLDESLAFTIEGGRHPVVEQTLETAAGFVANDCALGARSGGEPGRLLLVTGPNMAGKSTYLRQNALIALLAQVGAFVPAALAHIGLIDRLFSRVGAADDISRGRSTFMVEMVEAAAILNQASTRSLVIMDEIGRGTATYDGLSIAWGVVEHLHDANRARGLFATHYHELTALTERLPRLDAVHVKVKEWRGDVVFLHEVAPGAADRSYGVQVGRLAGLPPSVVKRAKAILAELEAGGGESLAPALPLFAAPGPAPDAQAAALEVDPTLTILARQLRDADLDDLSPREAQAFLYALRDAL
ncbi:MAG: DNA mismatch repair protein MutS, partial [Pseudomonadota bacterium]